MSSCPVEPSFPDRITLAHGSGGRLTRQLIEQVIVPRLNNPRLAPLQDSALLGALAGEIVMTTDSYVISPIFFPGGDIGQLSVCGTVNDLAMMGARPLYLTLGLILEEGLLVADLIRIVDSIAQTARQAGVEVVAGDTKVVEKGKGDQVFINTAGVGVRISDCPLGAQTICAGDAILISGDIGRHGVAVMTARENQSFESPLYSDLACLHAMVADLLEAGIDIHCLRDLTRGGLATACLELAQASDLQFDLSENLIPVQAQVTSLCQILGLDPLYIANEGCFVMILPEYQVESALKLLKQHEGGQSSARVGQVVQGKSGWLTLKNTYGVRRKLDWLVGEQLPRIC